MSAEPLRLHRDDLEQLADLVAERLAAKVGAVRARGEWLDAAQVAARFGVDRGWVYEHADRLGAIRLGNGPRGRLRFDAAKVDDALTARDGGRASDALGPAPRRASRRRSPRTTSSGSPLLPIRGVAGPEIGGVE